MQNATRVQAEEAEASLTDAELVRLEREHRELKARLSELNSRLYLSAEEQVERKKIQKLKLAKKDRLAQLGA